MFNYLGKYIQYLTIYMNCWATLELPQKWPLQTTFELDLTCQTIPDLRDLTSFVHFLHALCTYMQFHNIHICGQF